MSTDVLPDFQKFLKLKKLAPTKQVPFYAFWVSRFLKFSNESEAASAQEKLDCFLSELQLEKAEDWQLKQAKEAVQIYMKEFSIIKKALQNSSAKKNIPAEHQKTISRLREIIRLKHFAYSTERTYIEWAKRFFDYILRKKNILPQEFDSSDVRGFLTFLAVEKRVSSSSQNQAFNALLFLFRNVLKIDLTDMDKTVRAKRGLKLPVVLSVEEVQEVFKQLSGKNLLMLKLLYGSGMRLMELLRLRVKDIDFSSGAIVIRGGKGDKDRTTMLPQALVDDLKVHLEEVKKIHEQGLKSGNGEVSLPESLSRKYPAAAKDWAWQYVFPAAKLSIDPKSGKIRRHHITPNAMQKIVAKAVRQSGIAKQASVHTFRHSFATHLLINGVNIREIQELLGHKNVETTMIYTHVVRNISNAPKSPLDIMAEKNRIGG